MVRFDSQRVKHPGSTYVASAKEVVVFFSISVTDSPMSASSLSKEPRLVTVLEAEFGLCSLGDSSLPYICKRTWRSLFCVHLHPLNEVIALPKVDFANEVSMHPHCTLTFEGQKV